MGYYLYFDFVSNLKDYKYNTMSNKNYFIYFFKGCKKN